MFKILCRDLVCLPAVKITHRNLRSRLISRIYAQLATQLVSDIKVGL